MKRSAFLALVAALAMSVGIGGTALADNTAEATAVLSCSADHDGTALSYSVAAIDQRALSAAERRALEAHAVRHMLFEVAGTKFEEYPAPDRLPTSVSASDLDELVCNWS